MTRTCLCKGLVDEAAPGVGAKPEPHSTAPVSVPLP